MPFGDVDVKVGAIAISEISTTAVEPVLSTVKMFDPTYGAGEFIFLRGVASLAAGDIVTWDSTGQTTRAGTASRGQIAVAAAAVPAGSFGWFQRSGLALVNSGANAVASGAAIQCSGTATIDDTTTAGQYIDGMTSRAANSGGFTLCQFDKPCMNGR